MLNEDQKKEINKIIHSPLKTVITPILIREKTGLSLDKCIILYKKLIKQYKLKEIPYHTTNTEKKATVETWEPSFDIEVPSAQIEGTLSPVQQEILLNALQTKKLIAHLLRIWEQEKKLYILRITIDGLTEESEPAYLQAIDAIILRTKIHDLYMLSYTTLHHYFLTDTTHNIKKLLEEIKEIKIPYVSLSCKEIAVPYINPIRKMLTINAYKETSFNFDMMKLTYNL